MVRDFQEKGEWMHWYKGVKGHHGAGRDKSERGHEQGRTETKRAS